MGFHRRLPRRRIADRRFASRVPDYRSVTWRDHDGVDCEGWLVTRSTLGVAMLTENGATPPAGACIDVAVHARHADRFEKATVVRVDQLSGLLDLVSAEYIRRRA